MLNDMHKDPAFWETGVKPLENSMRGAIMGQVKGAVCSW